VAVVEGDQTTFLSLSLKVNENEGLLALLSLKCNELMDVLI